MDEGANAVSSETEQVHDLKEVTMRRMFSEYFIYIAVQSILLICGDTVYVRAYSEMQHLLVGSTKEEPSQGTKPW